MKNDSSITVYKAPQAANWWITAKKKSTPHNKQNVHHSDVDVCCLTFSYPFCKMFTTEVSDLAPVSVYLWQ
jgi:hypothetical protein